MYPERLSEMVAMQDSRIRMMRYDGRADPSFIPVLLTGGIGDAILSITTLRRLKSEGYEMLVSSPHAEAFRYFCKDIAISAEPLPEFTWYLEIDSIARFSIRKGFSGFLMPEHKKLFDQQQAWFRENPSLEQLVQKHPKDKFLLTRRALEMGVTAVTMPLTCLGFKDIYMYLPQVHADAANHITIHDGYDASYRVSGRATKTWKWEHWNQVVRELHGAYPALEIIQLGGQTARPIDGVDRCLINQTTLNEAFSCLSQSRLHIDTDSGLVHAATMMGVPCITMFGPTSKEFYGHEQNTNVSRETSCSGGCFHLTRNWMDKCPVGYQTPRCMDDISPVMVMDAVRDILK